MPSLPNPSSVSDGVLGWVAFLGSFWRTAGKWWTSTERWQAIGLSGSVVVLTVLQVAVAIALNIWNLRFFNAIEQRAFERFVLLAGVFAVIIVINVAVTIAHLQAKRRLQVSWRRWLTRTALQDWMTGGREHTLAFATGRHDNPDGRIAEDIRIATEYAVDISHSGLYSTILLVSFVNILWETSGSAVLQLGDSRLEIPGHLVWVALLYTVIATWIALRLGTPMIDAATRRQATEAEFRFGLARARNNSLGIALMGGEPDERRRLLRVFRLVIRAWNRQTTALRRFFYYMSSWPLLNQMFPVLVSAPRYIDGVISLGVLMQTAQAFGQVVAALSWPVDNLAKAAEWRASGERVRDLLDSLETLKHNGAATGHVEVLSGPPDQLSLRQFVMTDAEGRALSQPLDLTIRAGERIVITGDSALTAQLFHSMAELSPWCRGQIVLPAGAPVHFLPERPYLPSGSLHSALSYPERRSAFGAVASLNALSRAGLTEWGDRLEQPSDWAEYMSLRERQRFGFARVLLHRPGWLVLHDATTALDPAAEEDMLRIVREARPDATIIVVGGLRSPETPFDRSVTIERA